MARRTAENPFQGAAARTFQKNQVTLLHIFVNGQRQFVYIAGVEKPPGSKRFDRGFCFFTL